ncbi:hypothetical protein JW977_00745 [Candidatus Falkowbacteria bacterium]|nr:hypothetical protein [Candidatus Falkowbacteria bacterium]
MTENIRDEFVFKPEPSLICRRCGGKGGKHTTTCPEYPKSLIKSIDIFVTSNAPYLQESGKKMDKLIENLEGECSKLSIEERWNALERMKLNRENLMKKFRKPPKDLQNELALIERILDKWHIKY